MTPDVSDTDMNRPENNIFAQCY